ncbi:MAG: hypothetical protein HYT77_04530 [Deltaproteobacteria bacterium]|nr:hypothetical protein [Deltaproteobacteria bacterium]
MPSAPFCPSRIYVDRAVLDQPLTQKILRRFQQVPTSIIDDPKQLKKPAEMTWAKKGLLLTWLKPDPIKEFKAMSQSVGHSYYSADLVSNCHLECTYCILQSYLGNNPLMTVYTNQDEIFERMKRQLMQLPLGAVVGTGKIADSLAIEEITGYAAALVRLFANQSRALLELKTKSNRIEPLVGLEHRGETVISWSLNPPALIQAEEYKTASFEERILAAKTVSERGYPVGFHLDPIIAHADWKKNYQEVFKTVFSCLEERQIAWLSLGTLRFPMRQARLMRKRFPKNRSVLERLVSTNRKTVHYPEELKEEMLDWFQDRLGQYLPSNKIYRCMDF